MKKHILILTATSDFLGKFEQENVKILQRMGFAVHYAANSAVMSRIYAEVDQRLGRCAHES